MGWMDGFSEGMMDGEYGDGRRSVNVFITCFNAFLLLGMLYVC